MTISCIRRVSGGQKLNVTILFRYKNSTDMKESHFEI